MMMRSISSNSVGLVHVILHVLRWPILHALLLPLTVDAFAVGVGGVGGVGVGSRSLVRSIPLFASSESTATSASAGGTVTTSTATAATSFAIRWEDLTCSHDGGGTYQLQEARGVLARRSRVALVGRNGAGKSTLLRILAAESGCGFAAAATGVTTTTPPLPPYTGLVEVPKDVRVAFVEQEPPYPVNVTVFEALLWGTGAGSAADNDNDSSNSNNNNNKNDNKYAVVQQYCRAVSNVEQQLHDPQILARASDAMDAAYGSWEVLTKLDEVAMQLRVHHLKSQNLQQLSGGERKRVALAAALIREPQLLLLDEPTNFLSLAGVAWLADALLQQQAQRSRNDLTLLMVTHDRAFLNQVCNGIVELDRGQLYEYGGTTTTTTTTTNNNNININNNVYAYYLQAKEQRALVEQAAYQTQKRLYESELEWMRRQPQGRQTKAQARIDAFRILERAVQKGPPTEAGTVNLVGAQQQMGKKRRIGGKILSMRNVHLTFGSDKVMLDGFSYDFCKGDRICLSGANGVGKTSFLRVLTGEQPPDSGIIEVGDTIVLGVYDQLGLSIDDPTQTVLDFVLTRVQEASTSSSSTPGGAVTDVDEARRWLRQFEFPKARWAQRVSSLSGGERRRLQLLAVLTRRPNFLVMDEPSVDLDIPTLQALEAYLQDSFEGVLLLVSHDRYFADKVTDHLFVFEGNGVIKDVIGSLSDYAATLVELENQRSTGGYNSIVVAPPAADYKQDRDQRNQTRNAARRAMKDMDNLEKSLEKLKVKAQGLGKEIDASGSEGWSVLADLSERLDQIHREIDEKELKWMELAEVVEEAEADM